jgi:hypothetical protein
MADAVLAQLGGAGGARDDIVLVIIRLRPFGACGAGRR